MDTAHEVTGTGIADVLITVDDIRLGIDDYADGYAAFHALDPHRAIEKVWAGWKIITTGIYHLYRDGIASVSLTALLTDGTLWAGADVHLTHISSDLDDDDAWVEKVIATHADPYREWETFTGEARARAAGPDALDRGYPFGDGPSGLADHLGRYLPTRGNGYARWGTHARISHLLLTCDPDGLPVEVRDAVRGTQLLAGLGGFNNLTQSVEEAAVERVS